MRALFVAVSLLALVSCGPAGEPQDTGPAMPEALDPAQLQLTCAAFAGLTPATLAERFGPGNISTQTMPGPEGENYEATLVFANDPTRRIEVIWNEAGNAVANVGVDSASTHWTGPSGLAIGMQLPEVERINGRTFKLWGFSWDYAGWVSDWSGGALAPANNCMTRVRFHPSVDVREAMGDSEFESDDAAIRRAAPTISEFGVVFTTP